MLDTNARVFDLFWQLAHFWVLFLWEKLNKKLTNRVWGYCLYRHSLLSRFPKGRNIAAPLNSGDALDFSIIYCRKIPYIPDYEWVVFLWQSRQDFWDGQEKKIWFLVVIIYHLYRYFLWFLWQISFIILGLWSISMLTVYMYFVIVLLHLE
jgi:hypothetical protein